MPAPKGSLSKVVEILPASDVVYSHKHQGNNQQQLYFMDFSLKRQCEDGAVLFQTVRTGDLVAVECNTDKDMTKHFKMTPCPKPLKGKSWKVGQVLALSTEIPNTNQALIQWLLPMKHVQDAKLLSKEDLATVKQNVRGHFMLWLQHEQASTVDLTDILPIDVRLEEEKYFVNKQVYEEVVPGDQAFGFSYHCERKLTAEGVVSNVEAVDFAAPAGAVPSSLVGGWQAQFIDKDNTTAGATSLVAALTRAYQPADDGERFKRIAPEEEEEELESIIPAVDKVAPKRKSSAAGKKAPTKKKAPAKTAPSKRKKATVKERKAPEKKAAVKKRTKAEMREERPSKKARRSSGVESTTASESTMSTVGTVCYEHKLKKQVLHFFKDVLLPNHRHLSDNFRVHVGDLVAIALVDAKSDEPIYTVSESRRRKKLSEWHPFERPWSPAQVVAIFRQDDSEYTRLEVRWFYRPNDLPPDVVDNLTTEHHNYFFDTDTNKLLSGRKVVEIDEDVFEVPCESVLGRIALTSDPNPSDEWLSTFVNKNDRVPQMPLICRHVHRMKRYSGGEGLALLRSGQDWTDYSNSSAAFRRGIACPKAWPGQIKRLCLAYGVDVAPRKQGKWKTKSVSFAGDASKAKPTIEYLSDSSQESSNDNWTTWPEDLLSSDCINDRYEPSTGKRKGRVISISKRSDGDREFLQSIPTSVVSRRCDPRATAKKTSRQQLTLRIGDIVCVAFNGANLIARSKEKHVKSKNPWFPFLGPWRIGQVLSIYRDVKNSDAGESTACLEVRWFLRRSDLPQHVLDWMPIGKAEVGREEVYESDKVDGGVPSSHVLGYAKLFLGHQTEVSNPTKLGSSEEETPGASCRCRYYYSSAAQRFQPLFCAEISPRRWFQRLIVRGFNASTLIRNDENLAKGIELCLDVALASSKRFDEDLFHGMIDEPLKFECALLPLNDKENTTSHEYYVSTHMVPQWSKFAFPDVVCAEKDRKGLNWTVKVGDLVAVEMRSEMVSEGSSLYPFVVGWRPAQILAIYRERQGGEQSSSRQLRIQIRWFYRRSDHRVLMETSAPVSGLDFLYSTNDVLTQPIAAGDLLGPISLFPGTDADRRAFQPAALWNNVIPFLPVTAAVYAGNFDIQQAQKVVAPPLLAIVRNGVKLSSHYGDNVEHRLFEALRAEARSMGNAGVEYDLPMQCFLHANHDARHSPMSQRGNKPRKSFPGERSVAGEADTKARTSVPAFHVDMSKKRKYYTELDVEPPYDSYLNDNPCDARKQDCIWTLRLGDCVVIRCKAGAGRSNYQFAPGFVSKVAVNSPFKAKWAIGEVVSIFSNFETAAPDSGETLHSDDSSLGIKLEIRWFYRASEIGHTRSQSTDEDQCEEIYESDHYDEVAPENLLAPFALYEQPQPIEVGKLQLGMPVTEFYCQRFWSVHRKSVIAVGDLEGRIARGRVNSKCIANDASLKESLANISPTNHMVTRHASKITIPAADSAPWAKAFSKAISKLSLTDASKEAHDNGAVLVGREKERKQIMTFLRASVRGDAQDGSRSSLFVAGPPGTGKTASIRAAVSELKREQSAGKVPGFDFVMLNGMEMRHPFEAYVKLWEEVNGENVKCNPETAASKLEAYFSGKGQCDDDEAERVTVVLLDEIDYLVTKRQTVLYNFFDWPSRSLESRSKRRLVVVGVSNTLNLPERMHPRVQSRIGSKRIFFKSYNVKETVDILTAKMQQASPDYKVFDTDAILYASKKTAALSGDIRKAFHICRSAAEMIQNRAIADTSLTSPMVQIKDVLKVTRESFNSAQSRSVALATPFEVLLLVSLASLSKTTGREFGGFDVEEILTKMESMANAAGDSMYLPAPTLPETLGILSRLGEANLVSLETPRNASMSFRASLAGSGGAWPLVSMVLDELAVFLALKETPHNGLAQKYLSKSSFSKR